MAYTTINKSTDNFNTVLYTGNGSTQSITGVGFQPDWTWIKKRNSSRNHSIFDSVRGVQKQLASNVLDVEADSANYLTAFGTDGFSVGSSSNVNANSDTYAAWNWKAGNSAGSTNYDGSINSTVSVNTTAGFSIVKYTGTGSNATVGHGLGVAPAMIIVKGRTTANNWRVGHNGLTSWTYRINLEDTGAEGGATGVWNGTAPTSSVFSIGTSSSVNNSAVEHIAYCFAEKTGYSKFGKYTGNGNADGTFVYTGFKPAFIMVRNRDNANDWRMFDETRQTFNPYGKYLEANTSDAEGDSAHLDLLSNGFKIRATFGSVNTSNDTYIYMAFGQSLVGSNNIPCTAR